MHVLSLYQHKCMYTHNYILISYAIIIFICSDWIDEKLERKIVINETTNIRISIHIYSGCLYYNYFVRPFVSSMSLQRNDQKQTTIVSKVIESDEIKSLEITEDRDGMAAECVWEEIESPKEKKNNVKSTKNRRELVYLFVCLIFYHWTHISSAEWIVLEN